MINMSSALLIFFYVAFPAAIIWLTKKSTILNKIGAVVLAYAFGIILGNVGILPSLSAECLQYLPDGKNFFSPKELHELIDAGTISAANRLPNNILRVQNFLLSFTIPIAIPLLLLSLDVKRWLRLAGSAMTSMILGMIALLIVLIVSFFLLKDVLPEAAKTCGMIVGIYTGGTINLFAIGSALGVHPEYIILVNAYEMVAGFIFLLFILTIAQRVLNTFLPKFSEVYHTQSDEKVDDEMEDFRGMLKKDAIIQMLKSFGIALVVFAIGGGLSMLVPNEPDTPQQVRELVGVIVILTVTILAILLSLNPKINKLKHSFSLGMYLILIFSMLVASTADLRVMLDFDNMYLFALVGGGLFAAMALHIFFSWIFKMDTDTTIVTMSALTYSPPFVPVVAAALKNKEVIISGFAVGICGYIFGNFIGIGLAYFLGYFM
ncbi:MAG: DUF819 family protein [Mangrovibacterium sp.]